MILPLNRRLLLNGNNLLALLFILVGISSCAAKKITASELASSTIRNAEVVAINIPKEKVMPGDEDSLSRKPVIFDLEN